MNVKNKPPLAPGLIFGLGLVWALPSPEAWSVDWWFFIVGCTATGVALNMTIERLRPPKQSE